MYNYLKSEEYNMNLKTKKKIFGLMHGILKVHNIFIN